MTFPSLDAPWQPDLSDTEEWSARAYEHEREGLRCLESRERWKRPPAHDVESIFCEAFDCLAQIARSTHTNLERNLSFPIAAEESFRRGLPDDVARNDLLLAFRLAVAATLGGRSKDQRRCIEAVAAVRPFHFGDYVLKSFLLLTETSIPSARFADLQRGFIELRAKPWIDGSRGGNAIACGFDHLMEIVAGTVQQRFDRRIPAERFAVYVRDHARHARAAFEGAAAREMLLHLANLLYFGSIRIASTRGSDSPLPFF